ncbi:Metallopeptidase ImmA [Parageobacillus caldoxylosilyticus]|uniref:ImmA/IrrE family metallo-endopeptidase n=1 Tax=Saccharococcus caldoxylosilyticus TaxID=81408 RepID=UPI001C4DEA2A|nr:ImmA/IrrE family metallo-endopeptidase [Parageobacillus caldoxylosilyticus]QXJ39540.1 Metallopeptidase ImmA [Parageobacillus caldoxylosilyticus]
MKAIKEVVRQLIKTHKSNDPFQIAKEKNIIILFAELGATLGFYSSYKRIQFIHLNNQLDEMMQRFVCAHELGHAVLHPKSNTPFLRANTLFSVEKLEVEANTFAVELLLPDDIITQYQNTDLTIYDVAEMHSIPRQLVYLKNF